VRAASLRGGSQPVRTFANTAGHDSPYYSPWATHNVAEGSQYNMEACREKGGKLYACSKIVTVTA
jgi:hypothetical protein